MTKVDKHSDSKAYSPIRIRYILPFTIFVGLIFYALIWISLNDQQSFIESELESKGKALSTHIQVTIQLDLLLEDTIALVKRINELKSIDTDFQSLAFYNSEHQLLVGEVDKTILNEIDLSRSTQYLDRKESIIIYKQLTDNVNNRIGSFILSLSKKNGQLVIWNSVLKLISITLILLLFIMALLWIISRRINSLTSDFIKEREANSAELRKQTVLLNKALQKEKHLGEMKTHFVSVASHQFRTPLAIIQSNSDILKIISSQVEAQLKDKMDRSTARITREIARMTELMDDVLILGKVSSNKMSKEQSKLDLIELCKDIANQFNDIKPEGREIELITTENIPTIQGDHKMIRHSITNLISNAFKYSKNTNPILSLDCKDNIISIVVEDDGIGIPQKDLEHLFQPFYRASNVVEFSGSGLGLSIVKSYIELNDGTISVETEENKGSRFKICFETN